MEVKDELIKRAYDFAEKAHRGQLRKNGEPYFSHCLATAKKIEEWKLDNATAAAAFLHDTVEDTGTSLEEIEKLFGKEVGFLVDGVSKIGRIKYRGAETEAENLRKLILALSEDLRVVFIKLADRLHNMRTLHALPPEKQKRIAMETIEIYAPLAYRLGMQTVSGELEDMAFPCLYPAEFEWIAGIMEKRMRDGEEYLERVKPLVSELLAQNGIQPIEIYSRIKKKFSLYKKLLHYDKDIERVYDLTALRIIVKTVADCYAVLGLIHKLWPPLPGRIKDYIALPKPNGYQSLHTTVFCLNNRITEIQIRTAEMHNLAENGIAAHWAYKGSGEARANAKELAWVEQLRNWQKEFSDSEEFIGSLKVDFFKDRIFAVTPKGRVIDLPAQSTPVDFAYAIHGEVGDECAGAKVNGKLAPLNQALHSGDMIQILTQKGKKPSEDWLNFVKTANAKNKIRASLKKKFRIMQARSSGFFS